MLIMPLVTIVLGVVILGEPVSLSFLAGGALVLAGVYVGAFHLGARKAHRQSLTLAHLESATALVGTLGKLCRYRNRPRP